MYVIHWKSWTMLSTGDHTFLEASVTDRQEIISPISLAIRLPMSLLHKLTEGKGFVPKDAPTDKEKCPQSYCLKPRQREKFVSMDLAKHRWASEKISVQQEEESPSTANNMKSSAQFRILDNFSHVATIDGWTLELKFSSLSSPFIHIFIRWIRSFLSMLSILKLFCLQVR